MSSERWGALLHLNVISVFKLQMRPLCLNLEHGDPAASSPQKPSLLGTKFLTTKATWAISYCSWELEFTALGLNSEKKFPICSTQILQARKEWTNALNLQLSPLVSECSIFQHFQLHCSHCFYLYHGGNMNQEHVQYLAMAPLLHQSQQNSVVSVT